MSACTARQGILNYLTGQALCHVPRPAEEAKGLLNAHRAEVLREAAESLRVEHRRIFWATKPDTCPEAEFLDRMADAGQTGKDTREGESTQPADLHAVIHEALATFQSRANNGGYYQQLTAHLVEAVAPLVPYREVWEAASRPAACAAPSAGSPSNLSPAPTTHPPPPPATGSPSSSSRAPYSTTSPTAAMPNDYYARGRGDHHPGHRPPRHRRRAGRQPPHRHPHTRRRMDHRPRRHPPQRHPPPPRPNRPQRACRRRPPDPPRPARPPPLHYQHRQGPR